MDAMTMKMDAQYKEMKSRTECNNCGAKFDRLVDKQSARPSVSLSRNTQPNPRGNPPKPYTPPQAQNEHVNAIFTRSGRSYDPPTNPNNSQNQNDSQHPIDFNSDDEDEEPTPQPQTPKPKEAPTPKPYKPRTPYPQRLRKEKMEAQYEKFLDMIHTIQINVPLVEVLAGMRNYDKFLKELCPIRIAENMLVKVGKFTFHVNFVILEIEEDSKVPLILVRPFLHTANTVIHVKQKQLNLGVGSIRMVFFVDSAMKDSYSNDDTCFSNDVIDEIVEEDFDALLDEGSKILYSIKGTPLEDKIFTEFDEFIAMNIKENTEPKIDEEEITFKKITFDTDYKIKKSLEEPPTDLERKPLPD
ncbi:reverse transcriptase domain-containing protein [Tanacetum coccineum]